MANSDPTPLIFRSILLGLNIKLARALNFPSFLTGRSFPRRWRASAASEPLQFPRFLIPSFPPFPRRRSARTDSLVASVTQPEGATEPTTGGHGRPTEGGNTSLTAQLATGGQLE